MKIKILEHHQTVKKIVRYNNHASISRSKTIITDSLLTGSGLDAFLTCIV